jgi:hypothetical protein
MVQQILTNAARERCRVAILTTATTTSVKNTVTNYLTSAGISGATPTVIPDRPTSAAYGATVTVQVTIPFSSVNWLPTPKWLGRHDAKGRIDDAHGATAIRRLSVGRSQRRMCSGIRENSENADNPNSHDFGYMRSNARHDLYCRPQ